MVAIDIVNPSPRPRVLSVRPRSSCKTHRLSPLSLELPVSRARRPRSRSGLRDPSSRIAASIHLLGSLVDFLLG